MAKQALSAEQVRAAVLLAAGQSAEQVAATVGASPEALAEWRQSAEFEATMNRARRQLWDRSKDEIRALVPKALEVLRQDMETGDDLRLRQSAAVHILRAVGLYGDVGQPVGPTSAAGVKDRRTFRDLLGGA